MSKLFSKIGKLIEKSPFKVLLGSILIFAIMITGAIKINMATGNETLVKTSSDAYISNHNMQKDFGGDAIMVLLKGDNEDLLSKENIEKMWNVEERLKHNEEIFSFLSPASIVHQITDKQGKEIKKNIPDISNGLGEMSEKLIEIGRELGNKELPNPEYIEEKLDEIMATMDPNSIIEDMLKKQEAEMDKMDEQVSKITGGLGEMGDRLIGISSELDSKDIPNPKEIEKKLDKLMATMNPDKLMEDMLKDQEVEMANMEEKVGEMSSKLGEMGNGLVSIGTSLGKMNSPDMGNINSKLKDLDNISRAFDGLISSQGNLETGINELGQGLHESSSGLSIISSQLEEMAEKREDPELKEQLSQLSKNIGSSSQGLGTMSEKTENLKEVPGKTSSALNNIKTNLEKEIKDMKNSLPGDISTDGLEEISGRLTSMGKGLNQISGSISTLPEEIGGSLGQAPSNMLNDIMGKMEKEIGEMKGNLSGGISPDELKSMSSGFATMGRNLKEISGGLSDLPDKMNESLTGALDPSSMFADMTSQIEAEVGEMKSKLSGGIDPEELETMANGFVVMGENLKSLSEGLETFYEKSGMMVANIPDNQEELDNILYEDNGKLRDVFSETVIDDEHIMMMIKLKGNLEDSDKDALYEKVSYAMEEEGFGEEGLRDEGIEDDEDEKIVYAIEGDIQDGGVDYLISGKPVLDSSLREEMKVNMQYMVIMAAIIMLIVLLFVFKVRWRILSIGVILVSVIATLGLMGHLSVSMTMVSMAVFPILIGLGIDYSIQFHNRYEEEESVTNSLSQIGKAVAVAVFATMLGFISLYASPVPMIKDFGKMLTIGVVISFLGSIFLLMPILNIRDIFTPKAGLAIDKELQEETLMGSILGITARYVTKFAPLVLIIAIALAGWGLYADSKVGVETDIETFMPQDMDALEDIRYVRDVVGSTDQLVIYMEDEDILSKNNIAWMENKVKDIEGDFYSEVEDVKSIGSLVNNLSANENLSYEEYMDVVNDIPENQRSMFINEDRDKGVIIINIKHMSTEKLQEFVKDIDKSLGDAPMDVTVTGKSVLDVEMVKGLTDGRIKMTLLGIGLVFLALLLVYRSPFKALVPVFPIILIVGMSGGIMYMLGLKYTPITATLGALILGMGTEMTIMVLERYMEERNSGKGKAEAMDITVNRIGKATLASGLTTIGGFSVLMLSKFVILKDFGLMTVINVSLALMSTFIILPAVIWSFDRFIIKDK